MDANYREIEKKYLLLEPKSYSKQEKILLEHYDYPPEKVLFAETLDYYWEVPGKGDFVRLRNSSGKTQAGEAKTLKEITVKRQDKGNNVNRLEINVAIDKILDTKKFLSLVLSGGPIGVIRKKESIFFGPESLVVSLCEINQAKVFLEVEGPHVNTINAQIKALEKYFKWEYEPKNLFELYVAKAPGENVAKEKEK